MKRINALPALLFFCACIAFASCKKDIASSDKPKTSTSLSAQPDVESVLGTGGAQVIHNSNGTYTASFGGGITFGSTFIRPTDPDPTGIHDGEAIASISYVNDLTQDGMEATNGPFFDILVPTALGWGTMLDTAAAYQSHILDYFISTADPIAPPYVYPKPTLGALGAKVQVEITGVLVRDHTSPTGVTVMPATYTPTINHLLIVSTLKNGYTVQIYGPATTDNGRSYKANRVIVKNSSGTQLVVTGINISYVYNAVTQTYLVNGNVVFSNGSTPVTITFTNENVAVHSYILTSFTVSSGGNSYVVSLYGPSYASGASGGISSVTVTKAGVPVAVTSFSGMYSISPDGSYCIVTNDAFGNPASIKLATSTTLNINGTYDLAQ